MPTPTSAAAMTSSPGPSIVNVSLSAEGPGAQSIVVSQSGKRAQSAITASVPPTVLASVIQSHSQNPRCAALQPLTLSAIQALANSHLSGGKPSTVARPVLPCLSTPTGEGRQLPTVKLNVRVIKPDKKSQFETYVLRDLVANNISTPKHLKEEILKQFGSDIVSSKLEFPIGYIKNGCKVWIRTASDLQDVWTSIRNRVSVTLWCNGINSPAINLSSSGNESEDDIPTKKRKKRKRVSVIDDSDSEDEPVSKRAKKKKRKRTSALEEKNERVEEIFTNLREKHSTQFTTIQYRLWAEMVDVGTHK